MSSRKTSNFIRYKRGNTEIEGKGSRAFILMLIDLLISRIALLIYLTLLLLYNIYHSG
jgi:membrane protein CcdC involved in cytochrome C biogenesis